MHRQAIIKLIRFCNLLLWVNDHADVIPSIATGILRVIRIREREPFCAVKRAVGSNGTNRG